jgi:hypothetical protein
VVERGRDESVVIIIFEGAVMRATVIRLTMAIALAAAAWLSWSEAQLAERVGDASEQIATLRFADVSPELDVDATIADYVPGQRGLSDDVRVALASVAYWLGRYDAITPDTDNTEADAEVLLTAANAAFRAAQRDPGAGPAAVQRLDGVLNAYASALKAAPHRDAAYNYEYVARLRDQVARSQGKAIKPPPPIAASAGDLPAGPTIHGWPGAPPPDAKMEELEILAPMEFGDREAQPEATPGGKRERKG